ncbi:MAG TPA: TetR/AcrR family transcriptional regulator [Anaeromyxobacteraceae bacterium]
MVHDPPARRPSGTPRPEAGEPEKRRAILHAAVRVFAERGYHGCRIADVARQAGVAYGLVYHYFRNKDQLLASVCDEQWTIFIRALRAASEGPGSAGEQLAGVCRFAVDVFRTAPAAVRVLLLEVAPTPHAFRAGSTRQTFEEAVSIVAGMISRGAARGELRADADPTVAATSLLGALELTLASMVTGIVRGGTEDEIEGVKRALVEQVVGGLLPR